MIRRIIQEKSRFFDFFRSRAPLMMPFPTGIPRAFFMQKCNGLQIFFASRLTPEKDNKFSGKPFFARDHDL